MHDRGNVVVRQRGGNHVGAAMWMKVLIWGAVGAHAVAFVTINVIEMRLRHARRRR